MYFFSIHLNIFPSQCSSLKRNVSEIKILFQTPHRKNSLQIKLYVNVNVHHITLLLDKCWYDLFQNICIFNSLLKLYIFPEYYEIWRNLFLNIIPAICDLGVEVQEDNNNSLHFIWCVMVKWISLGLRKCSIQFLNQINLNFSA